MNDKVCLIYQPCGLGDILFLQKVCKMFINNGWKVIFPVIHEYEWLNDYIPNVDFISWRDKDKKLTHKDTLPDDIYFPYKEFYNPNSENIIQENFVFLNFFKPHTGRIMEFKYKSINLDFNDWNEYLIFNRNYEKENKLYYDILGLKEDDEYIFINKNYQMRPEVLSFNKISSNSSDYNNKKVIELKLIDGFTVFDWCKVIENASEIHMVETSLNYIMESKNINIDNNKKLILYSRYGWFGEVDYLFKLNWNYMRGIT
jgi:hypothetical protein